MTRNPPRRTARATAVLGVAAASAFRGLTAPAQAADEVRTTPGAAR
ncbi:hypothetical protein ACFT5C_04460 [Streptomyces sp. NPDC057116]